MANPDLDESALPKFEEPAAFEPEQYYDEAGEDTGVVLKDMTTEESYRIKRKALNDSTQDIGRTINRRHIHQIQSGDTTYDRLKRLKKHLCLSTAEREPQLMTKYAKIQSRSRNNIDS
ncbi:hypothetical protein HBI55_253840 [Parastagonospora nodorum]|nr:hypothetical protein HBH51_257760 [Parastagonospora nodorum]KAH4215303.1 hypothetical protein HBI06_257290 [Parastagonospora nodorum]KAH4354272.1 hypothetical protein HBH97_252790 [Parastagonospora nodorum]KAH5702805.1 hypothetical protein HBI20_254490 [Parastagonospora nodorum]KAH6243557.1 hypothetical protein HBI41_257020 [Parastagonospora nodorum]